MVYWLIAKFQTEIKYKSPQKFFQFYLNSVYKSKRSISYNYKFPTLNLISSAEK